MARTAQWILMYKSVWEPCTTLWGSMTKLGIAGLLRSVKSQE